MRVIGRLARGVSLPQAQAELGAVATRLAELHPATNRDVGIRLVQVRENVVRDVRRGLVLLLVAVGVVLAGACANVANLLLMKAAGSRKQMAVQLALGASRARLAAQVLAESLLLGVMGAALGVALAFAIVRTVAVAGPADIPLLTDARIDGAVLVKTDRDPQALTPAIRSVARALDPNLPLHHVRTADELVARSVAPQRFQVLLVSSFSGLVFALAVLIAIFLGRLAPAFGPVADAAQTALRLIAIGVAVILWFILSLPVYRRRSAV